MSEIVRLNVGGVNFTTTRATLCTYPDSMLGAMFSGNYGFTKDEHGCFFIDRDGTMFKHVLAFLRSNSLILPQNFTEFGLLKSEAEFYQIQPLLDVLSEYEKREPKLIEIKEVYRRCVTYYPVEFQSVPSGTNHEYITYVISRKDILLEIPEDFGLNVEKNRSTQNPDETLRTLVCVKLKDVLSSDCDISLRQQLASYLSEQGWKLLQSTLSSEGCDSGSPKHVILERWAHEY
ncbi:hypothetical protein FSP39_024783 [Pinctada imbricata]|uniref:BTB domain-containing protein n=1 Tax=Pinctada imbricata TaxID=66713 RepID=A0AA88YV96_PINIB|nr:hypothetical protein FSP39_024783 [Pinctada imbricata]